MTDKTPPNALNRKAPNNHMNNSQWQIRLSFHCVASPPLTRSRLLLLPKMADRKLVQMHWMIYLVRLLQIVTHTHTRAHTATRTHGVIRKLSSLSLFWLLLPLRESNQTSVGVCGRQRAPFSGFVHFNWPLRMPVPSVLIALSLPSKRTNQRVSLFPTVLSGKHLLIINAFNCSKHSIGGALNV